MKMLLWTGNSHNDTSGDGVQECLFLALLKQRIISVILYLKKNCRRLIWICILNSEL
jgi:hypothetical protein